MTGPGTEIYRGVRLTARPRRQRNGRWRPVVLVEETPYEPRDNVLFLLETEAALEALNIGRRLVDSRGL